MRALGPCDGRLTVFHPLSAEPSDLVLDQIDENRLQRTIAEVVSDLDSPRDRLSCGLEAIAR